MRPFPLTAIDGGINRLKVRGGAKATTLYDLVNGYVTEAGTVVNREGTLRDATLPSTTRGITAFEGSLHTFSHQTETVPAGYTVHVITHPTDPTATLVKIHFSVPFLGALYVVAEFSDGDVYHYWLAVTGEWTADTVYHAGDTVQASVDTGLIYRATRSGSANPSWAALVPRTIGDIIEPTEYNDFFYTVVDTQGTNPTSGLIEPTWPTEDGAQITEDTDGVLGTTTAPTPAPIASVPSTVSGRYGH